jgi:glutathione synthase
MIDWPPTLPKEKHQELQDIATDWATQNGLIIRSVTDGNPTAIHAPFALFPSPFPKSGYQFANEIQPLFNSLVDRVARDHEFLVSVMEGLSKADEFTSRIYKIYLENLNHPQKVWCGIHRSDYLLHYENGTPMIKQVELNTIASSFSSLSGKTQELHHYLSKRTNFFNEHAPETIDIHQKALPKNISGSAIAKGLAQAHSLYGNPK